MKNAKQIKFITLGLISAFTLSGCIVFPWNSSGISGTNSSTKNTSPKSSGSDLSSLEPHLDDEEEDEEDIVNPIQKTKFDYNYKDYSKHCFLDNDYTPSVGNPKLLVIPVWFTDSEACITENHKEDVRKDIEMAYFGTREETGWHSGHHRLDRTGVDVRHRFPPRQTVGLVAYGQHLPWCHAFDVIHNHHCQGFR